MQKPRIDATALYLPVQLPTLGCIDFRACLLVSWLLYRRSFSFFSLALLNCFQPGHSPFLPYLRCSVSHSMLKILTNDVSKSALGSRNHQWQSPCRIRLIVLTIPFMLITPHGTIIINVFYCNRSLESNSYNKASELQEEICAKKLEWRMAQLHLAAVKAQVKIVKSIFLFHRYRFSACICTGNLKCNPRLIGLWTREETIISIR